MNKLNIQRLAYVILVVGLALSCEAKKEKKEQISLQPKKEVVQKNTTRKKMTDGEKAFLLCAACHHLEKDKGHKVGPNLHGVFGRKAGTAEGFTYSEAVKNSGIIWSEETIINWLTKPTDYIPGTTMAFIGIKNKERQDALINYLKEETSK